jgi:hypothetical protein
MRGLGLMIVVLCTISSGNEPPITLKDFGSSLSKNLIWSKRDKNEN